MDLLYISQNIRKIRQLQKMTLDRLAAASGLSKGFISQVENFRLTPSLKALDRIAAALGVEVSQLFQREQELPDYVFGDLAHGEPILRDDGEIYGITYHALAYRQLGRFMDPFVIEYRPADQERDFKMHDAEEFFLLLAGELDFFLMSEEHPLRMQTGNTLYMRAGVPHKVRLAPGCTYARALAVYTAK